jgi:hypothetical protein
MRTSGLINVTDCPAMGGLWGLYLGDGLLRTLLGCSSFWGVDEVGIRGSEKHDTFPSRGSSGRIITGTCVGRSRIDSRCLYFPFSLRAEWFGYMSF